MKLQEENKALAVRFVLEHNQPNFMTSLDKLLAPGCQIHEYLPGLPPVIDRAFYNQFLTTFRAALPDISNKVEELIAEGDKVVVRWRGWGRHTGEPLLNIPATGQEVWANSVYIFQIRGGKITEVWNFWDVLNVMQQLSPAPVTA